MTEGVAAARARWAVVAVFFFNGTLFSTFISRVPSLKLDHGLSDGRLGAILTLFGLAALVTMQFVGPLVARFGSARVIRPAVAASPFVLAGIGFAGDAVQLGAAVLLMGVVHGTLDVAMNAHAVLVEQVRKRSVMNGCHAAWSISAVAASLAGAGFTKAGSPVAEHYVWVGAVLVVAGLAATTGLLPASADRAGAAADGGRARVSRRTGWTRRVCVFGAMGFTAMILEAMVISWSGVFLHDSRGATLAAAALGFTAFSACQAAGRLVGDRLTERYGAPALFRIGGAVAASGLAIVVMVPSWVAGVAGFAILGLGGSVLLPLIFSAVGRAGEGADAATFLSRFTTFTYAGGLIGPALIGWFAEATTLGWTLAGLLPVLGAVVLNARVMAAPERKQEEPAAA
ncbi:MFS transporter [Amycolatopsis solani]|uniref:MFS transporter n=1 Tax=Amycolatopsis solani TaxID=3028615 RepID=UPI0025B0CA71|nr:MFS transporter [Amycolatopsis sp. MEP2-6]